MVGSVTLLAFGALSSILSGFFGGLIGLAPAISTARIERLERVCSKVEKIVGNRGLEVSNASSNGVVAISKEEVEQKSDPRNEGVELLKDVGLSENNKKGGILGTLMGGAWNLFKRTVIKLVKSAVIGFTGYLLLCVALAGLYLQFEARINDFAKKCNNNRIDSCYRPALHAKKYMGQTEMWKKGLIVFNPYKLELLKQYVSYILGLGLYHNNDVGKK